jgi:hypothetical protein
MRSLKISLPLSVIFFAVAALAQVDTGGIAGIVSDKTGAVIPGAKVTIVREETGVRTELTTNAAGFYSAPMLRVGHYRITAVTAGFRAETRTGIELRVQDRLEMNFQLEVGATSAEVTVTATAPLLESETSSLGQVMEQRTVTDLPLNGRNFIQLATLTAGTLPSTRTAERDNFISNGARAVQNSYILDGVDNKNRIMGFDNGSAQIVQPIIDAIQEFKVQTSTFSAEFGQAAGGVVNVTLKSGTNQFHGSVFEFLRNSKMDATPFFSQTGPDLKQNQFGATFGGRVIKDRTFFFGSWQSSREVNAAPQIASVPTAGMRQGIFSTAVKDPVTKANFPQNTIPQNRWDPVAAKLLTLYPLPNAPGEVNNYFNNPAERVSSDAYNFRGDHRISNRDFIFARYSRSAGHNELPNTLPEPANQQGFAEPYGRSLAVSETHTFAPNKFNEFRFGYVYTHALNDIYAPRMYDEYGIKGALNEPRIHGLPQFNITGQSNLGTVPPGNRPIPAAGSGNYPAEKSGRIYHLIDNFSWIRGRHTLKFGADLERVTEFVYATNSATPTFAFNGTYSGIGVGDFLLGDVQNLATSQQQLDTIEQKVINGYAQDDWKATRKLTLNLGVRYELTTPWVEEFDRLSNFVLEPGPCYLQLVIAADAGRCGVGRAMIRPNYHNFAPRFGLAYQANAKTVVRGGFGMFCGRDENLGINNRLPNNAPFITSATFTGNQTAPAFLLKDGIPANWQSLASGGTNARMSPFRYPSAYVVQWNLNIQRQLPAEFVAQVAYTGSEAHQMPMILNLNQAVPGTTAVATRRPYQGWATMNSYGPYGNSNYHALLGKLERRFSKGFTVLSSYTYGHSIDNGKSNNDQNDPVQQNVRDLAANRGPSNYDVRHRFVVNGLWALPFQGHGVTAALVRGWQLSGIFSAQTGQPFTVTLSTDPTATGATAHPDRIRDGSLPADQRSVNHWFDLTAFVVPSCPCFGNSGRGILRGPGFMDLDLGIMRNFKLRESMGLQFRFESFNLMNHPNLDLPNSAIGNPLAGTIRAVVNPERQMQLAMKLYF